MSRLIIRERIPTRRELVDDGFGQPVRRAAQRPLRKAAPSRSWAVGAYTCELRKSAAGLVVLTVRGPKLPLPYHLVVGGEIDARRQAPGVVEELRAGRVPAEGVFRRDDEILPFRSAAA